MDKNSESKKAAIQASADYLKEVLTISPESEINPVNIKLEEIDQSEDGKYWLITLSYDDITLDTLFEGDTRAYKVFKVDKKSNQVVSMKIRDYDSRRVG